MKFNRRARLDTSQISDRRGMGRGGTVAAGGGIGALVILLLALCTGGDPSSVIEPTTEVQAQQGEIDSLQTQCQTGAALEENPDCRFVFYVNSIQDYWDDEFARRGASYSPATTNFFTSAVQTGCGGASSQVGPFYCPRLLRPATNSVRR